MKCDCIGKINAKLKETNNIKLAESNFIMSMPKFETEFAIKTVPIDYNEFSRKKPKRTPCMIASYCPFCGKKC